MDDIPVVVIFLFKELVDTLTQEEGYSIQEAMEEARNQLRKEGLL